MQPFVIRWTEGSGPRRSWSYLQPDGTWGEARTAMTFTKRREAYPVARKQFGQDFFYDNAHRIAAVRKPI